MLNLIAIVQEHRHHRQSTPSLVVNAPAPMAVNQQIPRGYQQPRKRNRWQQPTPIPHQSHQRRERLRHQVGSEFRLLDASGEKREHDRVMTAEHNLELIAATAASLIQQLPVRLCIRMPIRSVKHHLPS